MTHVRARLALAAILLGILLAALVGAVERAADLRALEVLVLQHASEAVAASAVLAAAALAAAAAALAGARRRETDLARARAEARQERSRLEAVLGLMPSGVLVADRSGRVVYANDEARRIWGGRGRMRAPTSYRSCRAWRAGTGVDLSPAEWGILRALRTGEVGPSQLVEIERFDGTRGRVLASDGPVRDAAGSVVGAVALLQDPATLPAHPDPAPAPAPAPAACHPADLLGDAAARLRAQGFEPCLAAEPGLGEVFCERAGAVAALVALAGPCRAEGGDPQPVFLAAEARGGSVVFRVRAEGVADSLAFDRAPPGEEPQSSAGKTGTRAAGGDRSPGRWPRSVP